GRRVDRETVSAVLQVEELRKTYQMGTVTVEALRGVNFTIETGEYVGIMGPSGCGKSTLLSLLGCLDRPSAGRYLLGGEDVSQLDDDTLSDIRGSRIGFVFQSYNLVQQLSVLENIEVPLFYQGLAEDECRTRAQELGRRVGARRRVER